MSRNVKLALLNILNILMEKLLNNEDVARVILLFITDADHVIRRKAVTLVLTLSPSGLPQHIDSESLTLSIEKTNPVSLYDIEIDFEDIIVETTPFHDEDKELIAEAKLYKRQGLKEEAAEIYRNLAKKYPNDMAIQKKLQDIFDDVRETNPKQWSILKNLLLEAYWASNIAIKRDILKLICFIGEPIEDKFLANLLEETDYVIRAIFLQYIGNTKMTKYYDYVETCLTDTRMDVISAAINAIEKIGFIRDENKLLHLFESENFFIAESVNSLIRKLGSDEMKHHLLKMMVRRHKIENYFELKSTMTTKGA